MNIRSRRTFIQHSIFGSLLVATSHSLLAQRVVGKEEAGGLYYRYPALSDDDVSAVVGGSHTNLEKVKSLVDNRPELANATWDWGFGDWETALGAASHMGRRDIAEYLMGMGARPDLFTYTMLGHIDAVKAMITATPGIQRIPGPHGISLLRHAQMRLRRDITPEEKESVSAVIAYLESLGDADLRAKSLDISPDEQKVYLGEYQFGEGEDEIFEVSLNSRKLLQIARKGTFGRVMNRTDQHIFSPGGAPSVQISFIVENGMATSLTIHEPEPLISAKRI